MPGGVWIVRSLVEKGLIGAAVLAANCRSLNTLTIYWKDWRIAATTRSYRERAGLWRMVDALRGSMDAAEYKHVVLGLIFPKYISSELRVKDAEKLIGRIK